LAIIEEPLRVHDKATDREHDGDAELGVDTKELVGVRVSHFQELALEVAVVERSIARRAPGGMARELWGM
jgi:hypothetical protein